MDPLYTLSGFVVGAIVGLTGVGGGSVRDLLIGAPVFWVRDPWVAPVCLGVALIAWLTPQKWWEGRLLEWADAAGLAAYSAPWPFPAPHRRRAPKRRPSPEPARPTTRAG